MVQKIDTALLASAFAKVANNQKYWNQWIVTDAWATLINNELKLLDEMKVTGSYLSLSLLRSAKYKSIKDVVDIYHTPNVFGIFRSKISKVTAFYVTTTTCCPKLNHHMPGGSTQFVREFAATIQTRAATATNNTTTDLPSTTPSTPPPPPPPVEAEEAEQQECHPRKKAKRWMSLPAEQEQKRGRFTDGQFGSTTNITSNLRKRKAAPTTTESDARTTAESDAPPPPPPPTNITANEILNQDFFESPEANCLFGTIGARTTEDDVSVRTVIQKRIDKLTEGFSTPNGWKCVLEDLDSCGTCSPFQIYNIQIKCRYVVVALRIALRKMGQGAGGATWSDCCKDAMDTVNDFNRATN